MGACIISTSVNYMGPVHSALVFVTAVLCCQGLRAQQLPPAAGVSALPWLRLEKLSATRERPLFTPGRRRAELSTAVQLPAPGVALEEKEKEAEIELTGLIEEDNVTIIFLRTGSQTVILRSGDKFGRWQIEAINKISVQLMDGTKRVRLEMFSAR
jgi:hypothetical protein